MKMRSLNSRFPAALAFAASMTLVCLIRLAGAEEYVNMEEAVKRGLQVNDAVQAAQYQTQSAEAQRKSALGGFGPSVTLGYGYTRYDRGRQGFAFNGTALQQTVGSQDLWTMNLNVSQPLFTGFRLLNTYQRAAISARASEEALRQTRLQLIQLIQSNFLELLKAREDVRSAEDSLARLRSQLKVSQAFFDVGLQPRLDVLQAESDVAQAEQVLVVAQNVVATQQSRLNTLLDWPVDRQTSYVGTLDYFPFEMTLEEALATAEKSRPSLALARSSVDVAQRDVQLAQSPYYPQVAANFDYFRYGDDPAVSGGGNIQESDEWRAGAALQWQIFNSFSTYYGVRREQYNVLRLQEEISQEWNQISLEVQANLLDVESARQRIDAARKGVAAAREGYRMAEARYKAQVGTITEVLDAQARLTSAEANLTQSLADYQRAVSRVYTAMGVERVALER
jgi:outer membrane protein